MNRIIALLVIAQFICLSQSAQVKRAPDACPGSNNRTSTSTSKEYAYLSKRSAAKDNSDFSKPKYQSIYAKNTNVNAPVKRGKAIAKEERIVNNKPAHTPNVKEKQTVPVVIEDKNNSIKENSEPEVEAEFEQSATSEKKTETTKPMDVIQTEKVISPESKSEVSKPARPLGGEEGKTASSKKSENSTSKKGNVKSSDLTTTKATKQKQQKKTGIKKGRLGKKCVTDCPEF